MVHKAEAQLRDVVIGPCALAESAGLHIALALPGAQEDIPPAAPLDHAPGDVVVLVFIAVARQLRPVVVPLKVGPHLVADMFQIGVVSQVIPTVVFNGADALDFGLNGLQDPDGVDVPEEGGFPVHRGQNALQRLIGGHLIGAFFAPHAGDGVAEQSIVPGHLEFHQVGMDRF